MAMLLIFFALFNIIPSLKTIRFGKNKFANWWFTKWIFRRAFRPPGALRSAFLIKSGLSKEAFIASAAVLSVLVDITRLSVYAYAIFTNRPP